MSLLAKRRHMNRICISSEPNNLRFAAGKWHNISEYSFMKTNVLAGKRGTDQPVVTDHGLVTSRRPSDIPRFNDKMIEEFAEGKHPKQAPNAVSN